MIITDNCKQSQRQETKNNSACSWQKKIVGLTFLSFTHTLTHSYTRTHSIFLSTSLSLSLSLFFSLFFLSLFRCFNELAKEKGLKIARSDKKGVR